MPKIIIQGSKEENEKAVSFLKENYDKFNKTVVKTDDDVITVVDAYEERFGKDGFTDEEIDRACLLCCSAERRCSECPYKKEPNCKERVQIDYAAMIARRFALRDSGVAKNG